MLFPILMVQITASGCCDFIAQCIIVRLNHCTCHPFCSPESSKIYRCWIVWGQDIRIVIIPSFLSIAYLSQLIYFHLIKANFNLSAPLVTWVGSAGAHFATTLVQGELLTATWGNTATLTGYAASMVVNALVTGLIVFKILKVFLEVRAAERILHPLATGCTTLRHVIFVIIESGMALFATQLLRVVLSNVQSAPYLNTFNFFVGINQMFNVSIRFCSFLLLLFCW